MRKYRFLLVTIWKQWLAHHVNFKEFFSSSILISINQKWTEGDLQTVSLPELREYLDHVEKGISLRRIAQRDGVHPSKVLRRVRKIEAKRDDPLLDDILTRIGQKNLF